MKDKNEIPADVREKSAKKATIEQKPWISKTTGLKAIIILAAISGLWMGYNMYKASAGDWGQTLLWFAIGSVSVVAVYFFFNWFHSLFGRGK